MRDEPFKTEQNVTALGSDINQPVLQEAALTNKGEFVRRLLRPASGSSHVFAIWTCGGSRFWRWVMASKKVFYEDGNSLISAAFKCKGDRTYVHAK